MCEREKRTDVGRHERKVAGNGQPLLHNGNGYLVRNGHTHCDLHDVVDGGHLSHMGMECR